MRYVSATGHVSGGRQEPSSAGAAFLRGSVLGDARSTAAALEQYAGDARLAAVFRQMRALIGASEAEMARRLGTNLATIMDFEAGAVHALPPWPETVRIVDRYAELSQIDPSPILSRLLTLIPASGPAQPIPIQPIGRRAPGAPTVHTRRQALPAVASVALKAPINNPSENAPALEQSASDLPLGFDSRARERETTARTARQQTGQLAGTGDSRDLESAAHAARRRRRIRRTLSLTLPIVVIAGVFIAMLIAPRPFYSLARLLPAPIDMPLRGMVDIAVAQTAPMREGLRWIEMDDPRLRKGDRIGAR